MRRVVVTGMGIVSCLGNTKESVTESLREGRSGISFAPEYAERGFRSRVAGRWSHQSCHPTYEAWSRAWPYVSKRGVQVGCQLAGYLRMYWRGLVERRTSPR